MPTYPLRSNARFTCDRSSARTSDCSYNNIGTTSPITPMSYSLGRGVTYGKVSRLTTVMTCMTREILNDAFTPKRTGIDCNPCPRSKSKSWHAYRTSNPPTHVPIAIARIHGSHPPRPPTASHPPTGATAIASPRNICVYDVYFFASEYQKTIASATGARIKHNVLSRHDANRNTNDAIVTNIAASA